MGRGIRLADVAFLGRVGNQFSPMSFANISGWLRADSFTDLADGDSVGVTGNEWIDQSGNSRDATQAGIHAVPTWESNEVNGLPVVRFGDDFLQTSLQFPLLSFTGDFTVILAHRTTVGQHTTWVARSTVNRQLTRNWVGGNDAAYFDGTNFVQSSAFSGLSSTFQLLTFRRSGLNISFRQNKTSRGGGAAGSLVTFPANLLCNDSFSGSAGAGDLGEIVFYSAHRSDAEVDQLYDNWFKPRWGLP